MSEKLLPCPFCGCQSVFNRIPAVYCADCGAQGKYTDDPEYRAKAWNTRVGVAPEPTPDALEAANRRAEHYKHKKEIVATSRNRIAEGMEYWRERALLAESKMASPSTASSDKVRPDAEWLTAKHAEFDNIFATTPTPSAASTVPPWQNIGTAPRDGTPVLLWAEAWEMTWGTQLGAYSVIDQMWETGEGSVSDNDADFDPDDEVDENVEFDATRNVGPTHWAPVPTPPSLPRNDRGEAQ